MGERALVHIGIDASRATLAHPTGTERYALQMIRALAQLNNTLEAPHQITLYCRDTPAPDLFPNSAHLNVRVLPMRRLWTHLRFAYALFQDRPDVTWVPAHGFPFFFPGCGVVTVHDLGYRIFPDAHPWYQWLALELYTRYSAWRAAIVLADSAATRDDLVRFYATAAEKIRVVYPGVDIPKVGDATDIATKYSLPAKYWLFLGTLQPRKNIERIVEAYKRQENREIGLVLAGGKGWKFDECWIADTDAVVTGYIDEADKGALYAGACALLFPSLYEGFGFPVIEAMGVGTPVICSNTSSLPELAGDAALMVDPEDVKALLAQMSRLAADSELREALIERGYEQASKFTWERAAEQALRALEDAAR